MFLSKCSAPLFRSASRRPLRGGLRPTLTPSSRRADGLSSAPDRMSSFVSPDRMMLTVVPIRARWRAVQSVEAAIPQRIVAGNEPAVSGRLGSPSHNAQWRRRHVALARPMERALPASFQPAMRTAHRLHSAHDTATTAACSRCPHVG
jgi:hypothetical protein